MGDHICYDRLQNRENMDHCLHLPSEQCRRARPQAYYNTLFDEKEHERTHSACPRAKASPYGSNGDDRRQRRKQGGAVGAVASRMRAAAKQTLGAATRAVSPKVTERARMLTIKYKRSDSIPPTKSLPIATQLSLSQRACPLRRLRASSPRGRAFWKRLTVR